MTYDPQLPAFNQMSRDELKAMSDRIGASLAAEAGVAPKVSGNVATLSGMFGKINELADRLFATVAQIEGNSRITAKAQAEDLAAARLSYLNALEGLRRTAEQARQSILDTINPIINPTAFTRGPTAQDTLVGIERTRDAWARLTMVLDKESDTLLLVRVLDLAATAATENDTYAISALRQNAQAYLESRGQKMARANVDNQLNQAMALPASPAMREAMQIQTTLDAGWLNLQGAFSIAQGYGNAANPFRVSGLPGWPGQPPVSL